MPLTLDRVSKSHKRQGRRTEVLSGISATFAIGRSVAILGGPGTGKSTLMQIMSGAMHPDSGRVHRTSRISFVVGASTLLNGRMTVREIVAFTARLYGADARHVVDFVSDFAELGPQMSRPFDSQTSRDMKGRLLYTLSYALPFDIYLADENLVGGSSEFKERCATLVQERRKQAGLIFATRNVRTAAAFADSGAVLHDGSLTFYPTLQEAIAVYEALNPRWQAYTRTTEAAEEDEDEDEDDTVAGLF